MSTYVVYTRVSKDADGTSVSPAAQLAECTQEAARRGWPEPEHRSDVDLSAWRKSTHRPAWQSILDGIAAGEVDGLIVHHLDRLMRQVRDLEQLIDAIDERGGKFPIYSVHGDLDLSTPDGRALARILVTIAQKESDDKSRRLKLVLGANAREGKPHGGKIPYGWQADRVTLQPTEAGVLRELVEWVLNGMSLSECARRLNDAGVSTRQGGRWYPTSIRQMLVNPRLAGLRVHRGVVVGEGQWEPLIDEATHLQLVSLLDRPDAEHSTRLTYWLAGLLECGVCGGKLRSRQTGQVRIYACRRDAGGCGLSINGELSEKLLEVCVVELWRHHKVKERPVNDVDVAAIHEQLAALESRRDELTRDFYVERRITQSEFDVARTALNDLIDPLVSKLRELREREEGGVDVAERWAELTAADRRDVTHRMFPRIVVGPAVRGRRFDPTRFQLWMPDGVLL